MLILKIPTILQTQIFANQWEQISDQSGIFQHAHAHQIMDHHHQWLRRWTCVRRMG